MNSTLVTWLIEGRPKWLGTFFLNTHLTTSWLQPHCNHTTRGFFFFFLFLTHFSKFYLFSFYVHLNHLDGHKHNCHATISITVTVYNGHWGSRCLGYGTFFFFLIFLSFLLNWDLQLEPPLPQRMANLHLSLSLTPAPEWTGLEMQCFLSPKVCSFFALFFALFFSHSTNPF